MDQQNQLTQQSTYHRHVFSKGIHLTVPQITNSQRVLTFFADDGRLFFAIPMGGRTMVGTTDTRVSSPETEITQEDLKRTRSSILVLQCFQQMSEEGLQQEEVTSI